MKFYKNAFQNLDSCQNFLGYNVFNLLGGGSNWKTMSAHSKKFPNMSLEWLYVRPLNKFKISGAWEIECSCNIKCRELAAPYENEPEADYC